MKRNMSLGVAGAVVLAVLVTGCGTQTSSPASTAAQSQGSGNTQTTTASKGTSRVAIMVGGLEKIIYIPYMLADSMITPWIYKQKENL